MKPEDLRSSLKTEQEVELTVTGRKTGKPLPRPVWFVLRGPEIFFIPVTGTDCQWYKNILRNPRVTIRSNQQSQNGRLGAITEKKRVNEVIDLFKKKYGPEEMKRYYPNPNVAASLVLDLRSRLRFLLRVWTELGSEAQSKHRAYQENYQHE